jgi:hypothetical protein
MKNWIEMLWAWLIVKLGYKYDESRVPQNTPYCYSPDVEKNKKEILDNGFMDIYFLIPCPYYKVLTKNITGCKLCGVIADEFDILLWDQCKICGISEGINEESLNL